MSGKCETFYIAGVWDLFHVGHLRAIRKAREIAGDNKLIVGVVSDEHCREYKGFEPIIPYAHRLEIIEAMKEPDEVVRQDAQFCLVHMKFLKVDGVFLGDDWAIDQPPHLIKMSKEIPIIWLKRTQGVSTSDIKNRIRSLK